EVRKCEARVAKLEEMRAKLQEKLADPDMYDPARADERLLWQKKFAEAEEAMERAEALWMEALEKLDKAEA
ncbi:ABC transporter ATP-binding protein, partial [Rhodovulum sulfidophilum]|nr:ABC transporter ATP-binding protein [Rhodovulum sulfidophilum]